MNKFKKIVLMLTFLSYFKIAQASTQGTSPIPQEPKREETFSKVIDYFQNEEINNEINNEFKELFEKFDLNKSFNGKNKLNWSVIKSDEEFKEDYGDGDDGDEGEELIGDFGGGEDKGDDVFKVKKDDDDEKSKIDLSFERKIKNLGIDPDKINYNYLDIEGGKWFVNLKVPDDLENEYEKIAEILNKRSKKINNDNDDEEEHKYGDDGKSKMDISFEVKKDYDEESKVDVNFERKDGGGGDEEESEITIKKGEDDEEESEITIKEGETTHYTKKRNITINEKKYKEDVSDDEKESSTTQHIKSKLISKEKEEEEEEEEEEKLIPKKKYISIKKETSESNKTLRFPSRLKYSIPKINFEESDSLVEKPYYLECKESKIWGKKYGEEVKYFLLLLVADLANSDDDLKLKINPIPIDNISEIQDKLNSALDFEKADERNQKMFYLINPTMSMHILSNFSYAISEYKENELIKDIKIENIIKNGDLIKIDPNLEENLKEITKIDKNSKIDTLTQEVLDLLENKKELADKINEELKNFLINPTIFLKEKDIDITDLDIFKIKKMVKFEPIKTPSKSLRKANEEFEKTITKEIQGKFLDEINGKAIKPRELKISINNNDTEIDLTLNYDKIKEKYVIKKIQDSINNILKKNDYENLNLDDKTMTTEEIKRKIEQDNENKENQIKVLTENILNVKERAAKYENEQKDLKNKVEKIEKVADVNVQMRTENIKNSMFTAIENILKLKDVNLIDKKTIMGAMAKALKEVEKNKSPVMPDENEIKKSINLLVNNYKTGGFKGLFENFVKNYEKEIKKCFEETFKEQMGKCENLDSTNENKENIKKNLEDLLSEYNGNKEKLNDYNIAINLIEKLYTNFKNNESALEEEEDFEFNL